MVICINHLRVFLTLLIRATHRLVKWSRSGSCTLRSVLRGLTVDAELDGRLRALLRRDWILPRPSQFLLP